MNMIAVRWLLQIGGLILLFDAMSSLSLVHDKRWFCQVIRLERFIFACSLIIVGVCL